MGVKLTTFIIGFIIIGLFAGIFGSFFADVSANYNPAENYSDSLAKYNQLDKIRNNTEKIRNETENIKNPTGALDVLGGMFTGAYSAIKTALQSFDLFFDVADDMFDNRLIFGDNAGLIKNALIGIITVLLFIGVLVAVITKRDL